MQDAPTILSLPSFAAGAGAAQKARACHSGSEGVTFAHSEGDPPEASSCIGAGGLRNGCTRLLPTPGSRQPSSALPGLWVGGEEDQVVLGRKFSGPRKAGGGSNPRDDEGRPQPVFGHVLPGAGSVLPRVWFDRDIVEGSKPHADGCPIQSRRIKNHGQSHCRAVNQKESRPRATAK